MSSDGLEMSPSFAARLVDPEDSSAVPGQAPPKRSRTSLIAGIGAVVVILALSAALAYNLNSGSSDSTPNLTISLPEPLAQPTTGKIPVYGRTFSYQVSAMEAGLAARYSALVRDDATGTEHLVFGMTGKDALEYGIEQVYHSMMKQGLVKEPSEETAQFVMVIDPSAPEGRRAEEDDAAVELKGNSGEIEVYGRRIRWKASSYISKFKLKWRAVATDIATGISDDAGGRSSPKGAVEAAVENLFRILIEKGIVVVPTGPEQHDFVPEGVSPTEETELTAGKSGNVRVCGRPIHYTGKVYYKFPLSLRYKCTAKDTGSGISVSKKGYKKGEAACKAAIAEVITKDAQQGVPLDPNDNCGAQGTLTNSGFEFEGGMVISAQIPMGDEETPATLGASKSGNIEVLGRSIHWKASGYLKGLKWRYKATATDKATGISRGSSGHKSGKGAVENAVKALIQALIEGGHMPVPTAPQTTDITITSAFVGDVEDDVMEESDIDFGPDETAVDFADVVQGVADFIADIGLGDDEEVIVESDEEEVTSLTGPFSKSGTEVIYGRTIKWKAKGRIKKFKWRYKCDATDVASGISRGSGDHKSGEGAVKAAIANVFKALDEAGIFPPRR